MAKLAVFILSIVGILSFAFGLMYVVGSIRTKDKAASYIGIGLITVCIVCLYFLAF